MTRQGLTTRQAAVLAAIREYWASEGTAPTFLELAQRVGVRAEATVHEHVEALRVKGYLVREYQRARSMALVPDAPVVTATDVTVAALEGFIAGWLAARETPHRDLASCRATYLERRDGRTATDRTGDRRDREADGAA